MAIYPGKDNGIIIRIYQECEGRIEKSVPRIIVRHYEACCPGVTLPPCRGLWGTLHIGEDIDCNTCPHPGVQRVESHLFTQGGFLGNSKGTAWKTESMQNMGV